MGHENAFLRDKCEFITVFLGQSLIFILFLIIFKSFSVTFTKITETWWFGFLKVQCRAAGYGLFDGENFTDGGLYISPALEGLTVLTSHH